MSKSKKKRVFKLVFIIASISSLYFVPWPIVKARITPLPNTVQEQVNKAPNYGFDGIIVYVDKKGEQPIHYTAGCKNRENKTPTNPNDLFKIASVGKLYTALCVAKLVRNNQLDLNKTLSDYLPELTDKIENADKITLEMLVRHRSGIPDYTRINEYWAHPKQNDNDRLAIVIGLPAHFDPDTDYEYSNTNYLLLTRIIEKVTGNKKFNYIKEHILNPLNLNNTYGSINDVNLDDVMSGYYVGYPNDLKTDDNGLMLATAADLGKFIRALNDGSVFRDKKEQEIYTSLYEFEHTGLIPGYQTIAKYHKNMDAVVIQFTNTVNFEGYNWSLSEIMYNRVIKILQHENER